MRTEAAKFKESTDAQVIERVLLGERNLFGVLFDRYAKKLFGYLWHFTNRRQDCEDFLQETFYKAYVNLKYCREREKFSSWLFSIAHNVAVSSSKKLTLHYSRELSTERIPGVAELASSEDLNLEFVRRETAQSVKETIEGMPAKYREVLVLFYYNDLSLKEIGDALGVPVNTVKTRLHRARQHLGRHIKDPPGTLPISAPTPQSGYR